MQRWMATEEDEHEAVQRLLVGLSSGQDVFELSATISELHRKNDTFPGEVYVRLAAEVLADTRAAGAGPIEYEGLREVHLEEVEFRGKENRKFQYAALRPEDESTALGDTSGLSTSWRMRSDAGVRQPPARSKADRPAAQGGVLWS